MLLCDLHRHLSGSISSHTVAKLLKCDQKDIRIAYSGNEKRTFHNFLDKFKIFEEIEWDRNALNIALDQVCKDAKKEGLNYIEVKYTIHKYLKYGWNMKDITCYIARKLYEYGRKHGIDVVPILAIKYDSSKAQQQKISRLIYDKDVFECVGGIDLVGDESQFDFGLYRGILRDWSSKIVCAHVGETVDAYNVYHAIKLGVNRIAHGILACDSKDIIDMATSCDIPFDVALTSNYYTGVVDNLNDHPIKRMLENGAIITIGTDDPCIFNTTISDEYRILSEIGVSEHNINKIKMNSIKYARIGFKYMPRCI